MPRAPRAVRSAAGQVAGGVTVLAGGAPARDSSTSGLLLLLLGVIALSLFMTGNLDRALGWLTGTSGASAGSAAGSAQGLGTGTAADRPAAAGGPLTLAQYDARYRQGVIDRARATGHTPSTADVNATIRRNYAAYLAGLTGGSPGFLRR